MQENLLLYPFVLAFLEANILASPTMLFLKQTNKDCYGYFNEISTT